MGAGFGSATRLKQNKQPEKHSTRSKLIHLIVNKTNSHWHYCMEYTPPNYTMYRKICTLRMWRQQVEMCAIAVWVAPLYHTCTSIITSLNAFLLLLRSCVIPIINITSTRAKWRFVFNSDPSCGQHAWTMNLSLMVLSRTHTIIIIQWQKLLWVYYSIGQTLQFHASWE